MIKVPVKKPTPLTAFAEDFEDNRHGWELTDDKTALAVIRDGEYWMENRTKTIWQYYRQECPVLAKRHWLIEAEFRWTREDDSYELGLCWGFRKKPEVLNRFSVSADGQRATVLCFERNHHRVFHRYYANGLAVDPGASAVLSILRRGDYFYCWINRALIYSCHAAHLAEQGLQAGYYVEPGLTVKSDWFRWRELEESDQGPALSYERLTGLY